MGIRLHRVLISTPAPSSRRVALRVTPEAQRWVRAGHPWVYDQAIRRQSHEGQAGDLAVIFDHRNRFLAIGLYDPTSPIRLRVLQHRTPAPIDRAWFEARLLAALKVRDGLEAHTTAFRLVHGENDGLPGLVIDRYNSTLVLKLYTAAWIPWLNTLVPAVKSVCPAKRLVLRLSRAMQPLAERLGGLSDGLLLWGPPPDKPVIVQEHGLRFEVDPIRGQKTGFFLDQRDNRATVEPLCQGRSVLDLFAYTGGFSVYAARGGAREVTSVDVNRASLDVAARNMALNHRHQTVEHAKHQLIAGDVFTVLGSLRRAQRKFDVVIVDPPSFAGAKERVPSALASYRRLTQLGVSVMHPGGVLVHSSCSSHVSAAAFFKTIRQAAYDSGWQVRELERTGHPVDHPVTFPEGAYLKCLIAKVYRPGTPQRTAGEKSATMKQ